MSPAKLAFSFDCFFLALFLSTSCMCVQWNTIMLAPISCFTSSHASLNRPPSQTHAFKTNPLSPLSGVYVCMSTDLSTGTWESYQEANLQRGITLTSPQTISCQQLLSKECHLEMIYSIFAGLIMYREPQLQWVHECDRDVVFQKAPFQSTPAHPPVLYSFCILFCHVLWALRGKELIYWFCTLSSYVSFCWLMCRAQRSLSDQGWK